MSNDRAASADESKETERKTDPGASRYGNFMNYYQFHGAEERVRQLPRDVWRSVHPDRKYVGLDIGCNAGELTYSLCDFLSANVRMPEEDKEVYLLGVDLDPILIQRSRESNPQPDRIFFEYAEFLSRDCDEIIQKYLDRFQRSRFDVAFCFSISMWIHLNHGDEGLVEFFSKACAISDMIIVEPQPWKCYRNASRRLRIAKEQDFPLIKNLKLRGNMAEEIEKILEIRCNFRKIAESVSNDWQRKILVYVRKD